MEVSTDLQPILTAAVDFGYVVDLWEDPSVNQTVKDAENAKRRTALLTAFRQVVAAVGGVDLLTTSAAAAGTPGPSW